MTEFIYTHVTRLNKIKSRVIGEIVCNKTPIVVAHLLDDGREYVQYYARDLTRYGPGGLKSPDDLFKYHQATDWPVDHPIFVRQDDASPWQPRHFAKFEGGKVYCWEWGATSHSTKMCTSWSQFKEKL